MAGRPRLSDDVRRVRVQIFIDPNVHAAAMRVADITHQPLSLILARMARAGARQVVIEMIEEQRAKEELLSSPPEPAGEDPVPELFPDLPPDEETAEGKPDVPTT